MTPALRTRCAITVASLLMLATPVAHAGEPGPREASPEPSVSNSLAGRQAGEGRQRPGRRTTPSPSASVSPSATPSGSPAAAVSPSGTSSPAKSSAPAPPPRPHDDGTFGTDRSSQDARLQEDEAPESEAPAEAWNAPTAGPRRSEPAAARHQAPQGSPAPVAQQISPLSLGIGMALMGLGIGFLGMRLRRR